jgi:Cu2+-exporting ATPase
MYIISGDQETPTKKLAEELGIEHYFAETLPENKAELIGKRKDSGKSVCYIGSCLNDSIALIMPAEAKKPTSLPPCVALQAWR